MDAKMIANQLNAKILDVVHYLLPEGKQNKNEWVVGSVRGEPGKSLKVCLTGSKAGIWADFASGEAGDALDLWKAVRGVNTKEALEEASSWLGYDLKPTFYPKQTIQYLKEIDIDWTGIALGDAVSNYLMNDRGLSFQTISRFEIGIKDNNIVFPYKHNGRLLKAKYLNLHRQNGKKKIYVTPNTAPCLFGWHTITESIDEISLTEGEIDAMTLNQLDYPALSLPFGGGSNGKHNWIDYEFENLRRFKRINLCFDQDSMGQASIKEVATRLGLHRCYIVQLPCKDANEFLANFKSVKSISYYFENAIECAPSEFCNAGKYSKLVEEHFFPTGTTFSGYKAPWQTLTEKFMFRQNELSVWSGINGHGKSQLLGQIALHQIYQGAKICIASLEMPPKILLSRLISQATGKRNPTRELLHKSLQWLRGSLWIYENRSSFSSKKLIEIMEFARCCYGIDVFIIDSLMKCGIGEEDYNAQKAFIEALCNFKNIHDCQIHLITHPRKMKDEGTSPGKMDIKGSGAISDLADNCFTIWRNKNSSMTAKQYDAKLTCYKQRNGDWEGDIFLWFDQGSYLFTEKVNAPIQPYIKPQEESAEHA